MNEVEYLCGKLLKCEDLDSVSHVFLWIAITNSGLTRSPDLSLQITFDNSPQYKNSLSLSSIYTYINPSYIPYPPIPNLMHNASQTYSIDSSSSSYILNLSSLNPSTSIALGFLFQRRAMSPPSSYSFALDFTYTLSIPSFSFDSSLSSYTTTTHTTRIHLNEDIPSLSGFSQEPGMSTRSRMLSMILIVIIILCMCLGMFIYIYLTTKRIGAHGGFVGFGNSSREISDNSEIVYESRVGVEA
jgi:hypothetical protein